MLSSIDDTECSHVILTKQEYMTLVNQRNRAVREKNEIEDRSVREISGIKREMAREASSAAHAAKTKIDELLHQVEQKTAEIAAQRALNENLLRISRERANADRGLRPKKAHTGYVVVSSSEKEVRYKTSRNKLLTTKVWETVIQSPYSVDFSENQARKLIEKDLLTTKSGLIAAVGITLVCHGSSYEELVGTEDWKEIKDMHNALFSRQLRANYRAGYWEYIIQHTKPLGIVPADMRAGSKNR